MTTEEIIKGMVCETCFEKKTFGEPPYNRPENKYIYLDLGGNTRCFCKKHMLYHKKDNKAIYNFGENKEAIYPCYGAELISDILKQLKNQAL